LEGIKQARPIELDKAVKPNPKCINMVFHAKGINRCDKPALYCKNMLDFGGLLVCTEKQDKDKP